MITCRTLISTGIAGLLAGALVRPSTAEPATPSDPAGIVTAIYTRAAKGKGDGGGGFVIENKAAKAKYLSKELIALWAKADAHTPKGDVGPIDFDPVTNSQDPDVKSFKVATEKLEADKAAIAVTITGAVRAPSRATKSCIMISCGMATNGRSMISRDRMTARRGRSAAC